MTRPVEFRSGVTSTNPAIAYEDFGDPTDPAILLIMGIGAQMLLWPVGFVEMLVAAGYRVFRFDNRDVGLSGRTGANGGPPTWLLMLRAQLGWTSKTDFTLVDMANDAVGVLDALGIDRAHIVGASMGGMIAQVLAASHPTRVRTLGIIFSSTNQPLLPPPSFALLRMLQPPKGAGPAELMENRRRMITALGGSHYPVADAWVREVVAQSAARGADPAGAQRQLRAVLATGDLRRFDRTIAAPTIVIHGTADRMIPLAAGRAVARAIPGARLEVVPGMAHQLPDALWPIIVPLLTENFASATWPALS